MQPASRFRLLYGIGRFRFRYSVRSHALFTSLAGSPRALPAGASGSCLGGSGAPRWARSGPEPVGWRVVSGSPGRSRVRPQAEVPLQRVPKGRPVRRRRPDRRVRHPNRLFGDPSTVEHRCRRAGAEHVQDGRQNEAEGQDRCPTGSFLQVAGLVHADMIPDGPDL